MPPFAMKILISKIYDTQVFWKLSKVFQESTVDRVIFVQREPENLLKEGTYYRCFLSWKISEKGWLLTAAFEQPGSVAFEVFQFLTIAISFSRYFL